MIHWDALTRGNNSIKLKKAFVAMNNLTDEQLESGYADKSIEYLETIEKVTRITSREVATVAIVTAKMFLKES